jgi:tetratricopeptide (TPR) repeat protein
MKRKYSRKPILNIFISIAAIVMAGIGIYIYNDSGEASREDIELYNKALAIYNEQDYFPATSMSVASYPLENFLSAIEYFQRAAAITSDAELKSMALSNIATMIARDYQVFAEERSIQFGLPEAVSLLQEAIRLNPDNEYAKLNLEHVESLLTAAHTEQAESDISHGGDAGSSQVEDLGY